MQQTTRTIGGLEVVRELARGGMGVVYQAFEPGLDRYVAIKVLLDPLGADPEEVARLRQEGRAAALLRHENVVAVHALGVDAGRPYLVMDLVDGESLRARLGREGPLAPREAARIALKLARALEHAHARGVLHRDLKPHNVLLDARGEPRLVDFGLARLLDRATRLTQSGALLGTPAYMSPEQANGDRARVGPATDVYGLGATLYGMLTGGPPFEGEGVLEVLDHVLSRTPEPPSSRRPGIDPALDALCLRCLAKAPGDRFASAGALAAALEAWLTPPAAARARSAGVSWVSLAAAVLASALVTWAVMRWSVRAERDGLRGALAAWTDDDVEGAVAALDSALARAPDDALLLRARGRLLLPADDVGAPPDPARRDVLAAWHLDEAHSTGRLLLAEVDRRRGDEAAALVHVEFVLGTSKDPRERARAEALLAHLLVGTERTKALLHADRALTLDPRCARAHLVRALVLQQSGPIEAALAACIEAIALDPDQVSAWRLLDKLDERLERPGLLERVSRRMSGRGR